MRAAPPVKLVHRDANEDDRENLDRAELIWRQTAPLGLEGIAYFAKRGIDITAVPDHGGLRFNERCPWRAERGRASSAAARQRSATSRRGIWRRPLSGEKPMTLGPTAGCIIRLWPNEAVERRLVLGEGPETVLAAATRIWHRGTLLQPAWAAGDAGHIKKFPILPGIEALTLLVDNDRADRHGRRAGQEAAADCADRWSAAGRKVIRLTPKAVDTDFNDVVLRHGR